MLYNINTLYLQKKIIMKSLNNFFAAFFFCLILFVIGAFVGVKLQKTPEIPPKIDSLAMVRIDSVRGVYQQVIDSINRVKPKIVTRVKWLKERDTIYYSGQDSSFIEVIDRKNNLIAGQDSLIELLDLEARQYSDMVLLERNANKLLLSANKRLSFEMDSTIGLYKDSLKFERKTIKKERSRTLFYKATTTVAAALGIYGVMSK